MQCRLLSWGCFPSRCFGGARADFLESTGPCSSGFTVSGHLVGHWQDACDLDVKNVSSSVSKALAGLPGDSGSLPYCSTGACRLNQSMPLPTPAHALPRLRALCFAHYLLYPLKAFYAMPASGQRMKLFLSFRLGIHKLLVSTGRQSGAQRDSRACPHCLGPSVDDILHMHFA